MSAADDEITRHMLAIGDALGEWVKTPHRRQEVDDMTEMLSSHAAALRTLANDLRRAAARRPR